MRRPSRGFTLIELMIVVMLIAIVAGLAVPQIVEAARNNALTDATNEVAMSLREARTRAARTGHSHRIHINASGTPASQLIRIDEGEDNTCQEFPTCTEVGPDYGAVECGVVDLRFDHGFYQTNRVQLSKAQTGFPGHVSSIWNSVEDLCVTPLGRLYKLSTTSGCGTFYPESPDGPLVLTVDRKSAGAFVGVRRCVIFPERGMPRTAFGSSCPAS